jgi:hypothetical protein
LAHKPATDPPVRALEVLQHLWELAPQRGGIGVARDPGRQRDVLEAWPTV